VDKRLFSTRSNQILKLPVLRSDSYNGKSIDDTNFIMDTNLKYDNNNSTEKKYKVRAELVRN
jgi:hypothetical protein